MSTSNDAAIDDLKRELRRRMRAVGRGVGVDAALSEAICERLIGLVPPGAGLVMVFDAISGEPVLTRFVTWCAGRGIETVAPDASPTAAWPADPGAVDVVIVPGLAFARAGARLGQGGGWYDRFLAEVRPDCLIVGVCFDEQLVATVPTATHDRRMSVVVTPTEAHRRA